MKSYDISSETTNQITLKANNIFQRDFDEIIFDNNDASIKLSLKKNDSEKIAKIPYQDISKFALRTEIEYRDTNKIGSERSHLSHQTYTHYVIYLIKKDGGILDLNYFETEQKAIDFRQKLEKSVQLNKVCNNLMKPERYQGFEVSSLTGPIEIKWKNTGAGKSFATLIITFLVLAGMGYGMTYLPSEVLSSTFFIMFVSIFGIVILIIIVMIVIARTVLGKKGRLTGTGGNSIVSIDSKDLSLIHEKNETRTIINTVSLNNIYGVYSSCYGNVKHDRAQVGVTTKEGLKNMYMFDYQLENSIGATDDNRGIFEKLETIINNDENFVFEVPGMDMIDKIHFEYLLQNFVREKSGREVL